MNTFRTWHPRLRGLGESRFVHHLRNVLPDDALEAYERGRKEAVAAAKKSAHVEHSSEAAR